MGTPGIGKRDYRDVFRSNEIFSDIYFYNVGHERCQEKHSYGPNVRQDYIIHCIMKGTGVYHVGDESYTLSEGQFFLIRPNEKVYYEADETDPWEYYWLGFNGNKVKELMHLQNITDETYMGKFDDINGKVREWFEYLINANHFDSQEKMTIYGTFFTLFGCVNGINTSNPNLSKHSQKRKKLYSDTFMLYVNNSYHLHDLSIRGISESMNLSPAYLSQVIKKEMGVSPMSYLKEVRLHKASVILESSQHNVQEVAMMVGYDNLASFSRAFKERFGIAPSKYKGQN